jgi:1-acyl-sn-glycerol-3-phosphate acyltransferase
LETPGPRVIVFNHQSALDMLWIASIAAPAPMALGKKEIAWVPIVNLVTCPLGTFVGAKLASGPATVHGQAPGQKNT